MEAKTANVLQRSQDETMLIGLILDGQTNLFRQLASQYAERVLQIVVLMITFFGSVLGEKGYWLPSRA